VSRCLLAEWLECAVFRLSVSDDTIRQIAYTVNSLSTAPDRDVGVPHDAKLVLYQIKRGSTDVFQLYRLLDKFRCWRRKPTKRSSRDENT